jgi:hypothetical protein
VPPPPRGKTGQTGFRNQSERFPLGNLLKMKFEMLKLELRTNMRDTFRMSPDITSFDEIPEASILLSKTPFSPREVIKKKIRY